MIFYIYFVYFKKIDIYFFYTYIMSSKNGTNYLQHQQGTAQSKDCRV